MKGKFLFVVTSNWELGSSGNRSGSWLEELAAPYAVLEDAGVEIVLASPAGGEAPLDPMSLQDEWVSDAGRRFLAWDEAMAKLRSTAKLDDVQDDNFLGLFLVGGTATTWDFPGNAALRRLVERHFASGDVVAGICHGVVGLADATDEHGEPLVKNRQLTCISNAEDALMGVDKIVPVLPEQMMRKLRAIYSSAAPLSAHVVCDPPFFTGQNPASAQPLAEKVVDRLRQIDGAAAERNAA